MTVLAAEFEVGSGFQINTRLLPVSVTKRLEPLPDTEEGFLRVVEEVPDHLTIPLCGVKPARHRRTVVLPKPEGADKQRVSPALTVKVMSRNRREVSSPEAMYVLARSMTSDSSSH